MKRTITMMTIWMLFAGFQTISALTYTVTVPEETKVVYIIGDMNDWEDFIEMQRAGDENKFTIDFPEASEDMEYCYMAGPGWAYEELNAEGKAVGRTWSEADVAVAFRAYYDPDESDENYVLTYTVEVPAETKVVYIVGDPTGDWGNFVEMQRVGTENKFTITLENVNVNMTYEYAAGPGWDYEEVDAVGNAKNHTEWAELDVAAGFKAYFDPGTLTSLTYTVEVPAETKVVYIVGDVTGDWGNFVEMQRVGTENKFAITLDNVNSDMDYEYAAGPGWEYEEVDAEGNPKSHGEWSELDVAAGFKAYFDPNGIATVPGNNHLITYCGNHTIIVNGLFEEISLYDLTGRKLQNEKVKNHFESRPLNPGIYLIKTDKQSGKVIVK